MRVKVKLYATLRRFAPSGTNIGEEFDVKFQGTMINELIDSLGFPKEQAKIIMVNGQRVVDLTFRLSENDLVVIFPPIGGG